MNLQDINLFLFPKGLKETKTDARTTLFFAVLTKQISCFIWRDARSEVEKCNIIATVHFSLQGEIMLLFTWD